MTHYRLNIKNKKKTVKCLCDHPFHVHQQLPMCNGWPGVLEYVASVARRVGSLAQVGLDNGVGLQDICLPFCPVAGDSEQNAVV